MSHHSYCDKCGAELWWNHRGIVEIRDTTGGPIDPAGGGVPVMLHIDVCPACALIIKGAVLNMRP